jgi:hypothetical protein
MKCITGLMLVGLSLGILERPASAQSNCRNAKGNMVEAVASPNTSAGTITDGGWLNGTTIVSYSGGPHPTADPAEVTFIGTFTLTTNRGQLKGSRNHLLDFGNGLGIALLKIDPAASTGIFEGATGALFFDLFKSITVASGPYYQAVRGQVCFARALHDDD